MPQSYCSLINKNIAQLHYTFTYNIIFERLKMGYALFTAEPNFQTEVLKLKTARKLRNIRKVFKRSLVHN